MKVKCANCAFYKFMNGLTDEPLGGCENDDVLFYAVVMDYNGRNWRLNQRNSNTLRYCKGFKPRFTDQKEGSGKKEGDNK